MAQMRKAAPKRANNTSSKPRVQIEAAGTGRKFTATQLSAVVEFLDALAPPQLAEPWDKVGLLSAPRGAWPIKRMLVALDLTPEVKEQCLSAAVDLLVCYHPPLFKPLDRLCVRGNTPSDLAVELAQEKIWLYSPHTALDAAVGGTNDVLAAELGLSPCGSLCLRPPAQTHLKLVVFVPESHLEQVATAVFDAGAGHIGQDSRYTQCSFRTPGTGTFFGDESTTPAVGSRGRLEFVREIRFETVVPISRLDAVVAALRQAHPYEEPAFDLLVMQSPPAEPGMGRLVNLPVGETLENLAQRCRRNLALKALSVLGESTRRLNTIGIMAGSCGQLPLQCGHRLDCVITGELKHHDLLAFRAAGVVVIMLGHAPSEKPVLAVLAKKLAAEFSNVETLQAKITGAEPELC
ncbi:MAG: Nif3-like dinuclear metal center hexameric protein [Planctomycetes bacterium]|nr:Nif3-like dinuclear metal center hexameric protein [Planctomycetota bacterium]